MVNKHMFKQTASRVLMAFILASQPSFAAIPPKPDMEEFKNTLPQPLIDNDQPPAVNPFNQDYADALSDQARKRYAGMPVIGIDVSTLIDGEHINGEDPEMILSMQSLYLHDVLERQYPDALKRMSRIGRERIFNALDSVIQGFVAQPNQPRRVPGVVCFINEPSPNGYYNSSETLDMLIAAHRCNPKYGILKLHERKTMRFRPQALEDALKVAHKVAKIDQPQTEAYLTELLVNERGEDALQFILTTYVEHLNIQNVHARNRLYTTLNNRLNAVLSEMSTETNENRVDILRREWKIGQGITSYFAAVYLKALVEKYPGQVTPLVKDINMETPLVDFINRADIPNKAPAARVAPRH